MQYVRNLSDSVSTAWNSINPSTLSGAIDVIVVEQEDGSYSCSPFHVRFGKFSLLRPSDKKVEFRVNGVKQEYSMKLGEGGEAFFIFETSEHIPESMQTSPLVSPATSPSFGPEESVSGLQDPDLLQLDEESSQHRRPSPAVLQAQPDDHDMLTPLSSSPDFINGRPVSADWGSTLMRPKSDDILRQSARAPGFDDNDSANGDDRCPSPPALGPREATERATMISKALTEANIPSKITDTGDLMLDMSGFKSSEEDMLRAEVVARRILSEELEGNYDIGALFGFDEEGNLWIYSSEDAKRAAMDKTIESSLQSHRRSVAADAVSDPGYQSDGSDVTTGTHVPTHRRSESDAGPIGLQTPPRTPTDSDRAGTGRPVRNYAKTLRLTSEQLKDLELRPGENSMSFTVNRATCSANMYLWKHETPVVISDIDGTITKSDALGHVLNMIGRDWTHSGIAKLYSDIALNGYNIMYLTSRSVGLADMTRVYLNNIVQDGCRMPHGPTILSPDRTMAALRREVYLRKPHIFKMATLRDISNLYGPDWSPFYAGFGNRLTDQISYRTVDVSRNRIFTINSNSEVSLDLLSLNKLKMSYVNINEVVDHYFPPVGMLIKGGGEDYTDFKYWRDNPLEMDDFSASGSDEPDLADDASAYSEDDDEEIGDGLADSYISKDSVDDRAERRAALQKQREREIRMTNSITESVDDENADTEDGDEEVESEEDEDDEYDSEEDESEDEPTAVPPPKGHKTQEQSALPKDITAEVITGNKDIVANPKKSNVPYVEEPVEIRRSPSTSS